MSLNVPAVETLYLAGVQNSINTAHALGITTLNSAPNNYGLSLVLGGGEVTLLNHVNAYASLANGGNYHSKTAILKVVDSTGKTLEQYQDNPGQQVVDPKYIGMLDYIMSTNDLRAPVFGNNNPLAFSDRPVAAKTGTTNDWHDGWTMGFTPSLVAGVWAGNNDNTPMAQGADGIFTAAPIWRAFMNKVLQNYSVEQFPKYDVEDAGKDILNGKLDVSSKLKVCQIPGKKDKYCLASDACPDSKADKKEFFTGHNILYYVNKDDPRGDTPKDPSKDPQYDNWEKAVQKWADKNTKFITGDVPTDQCKSSDFSSYKVSVSLDASSSGSAVNISGSVNAPYGVKDSSLSVDGNKISSPNGSFSTSYDASGKNNSDLNIKLEVTDNNGNSDSAEKSVHVAF